MIHRKRSQRALALSWLVIALGAILTLLGSWLELRALGILGESDTWDRAHLVLALVPIALGLALVALGVWGRGRAISLARDTPVTFLTARDEALVLEAIARFETRTAGEIRVHLEAHVEGDLLAAARHAFEELGMTATRDRNGVLFFVATQDRRFAVLGDRGIDERVAKGFWDNVVAEVAARFRAGELGAGLVQGITLAGEALATHFPPRDDDRNELPDAISRRQA